MQQEDVLVLPLDLVQFETHQAAAQSVLKHFGQVEFTDSVAQHQSPIARPVITLDNFWNQSDVNKVVKVAHGNRSDTHFSLIGQIDGRL